MGMPQDKLGVCIGLDEQTASARISRYENGVHEPPVKTARALADVLGVPLAYLYCDDDVLADILLAVGKLTPEAKKDLLQQLRDAPEATAAPPEPARRPNPVDPSA